MTLWSGSWSLSDCFLLPFLPSLFISILPFLPLPPLPFLSSLFSFSSSHCRFTLWSFWTAWQHIIKSSKLRGSAQVILPTMKPASSCALLADCSWFFVDKEGSTNIIRFVLFLPMIKRRRFRLPSFEIFAEVHSQQTSLLSASTVIIGLQIFFLSSLTSATLDKNGNCGFQSKLMREWS